MRRGRPVPRSTFALFTLAAAGCGGIAGSALPVEVTDSAGVEVVRSLSPDLPLVVGSEAVRSLGGKDTEEESFYQVAPGMVAVDDDGDIHVLDRQTFHVQVFDSAGRHLRSLGGEGGGPGELQMPFALAVAGDGRVQVADVGKQALVRWGADGGVLEATRLPPGYAGGTIAWGDGGTILPRYGENVQGLDVITEAGDTTRLAMVGREAAETFRLDCGIMLRIPPIFTPSLVWGARGDRVAVASGVDYVIDVYDGGRWMRSVRRDVAPVPATAALARATLGESMRIRTPQGELVCDADEMVEKQGFAPLVPTIGAIALAPDGGMWVQRFAGRDQPAAVDLFDADGRYRGTLAAGAPFPLAFLPDGRILVAEKDEMDVQRLVVRTAEPEGGA